LRMEPMIKSAIPVLPAADTMESLNWWTKICGFEETFQDATPSYAESVETMLTCIYQPSPTRNWRE
jgi:hypothetical protein